MANVLWSLALKIHQSAIDALTAAPDMLSPKGVCDIFGISNAVLNTWVQQQSFPLPGFVGKTRCWAKATVLEWASSRLAS